MNDIRVSFQKGKREGTKSELGFLSQRRREKLRSHKRVSILKGEVTEGVILGVSFQKK
jgi:hypothetical protein